MSQQIKHTPSFAFLDTNSKYQVLDIVTKIESEVCSKNQRIITMEGRLRPAFEILIEFNPGPEAIGCLREYYVGILNWKWLEHSNEGGANKIILQS